VIDVPSSREFIEVSSDEDEETNEEEMEHKKEEPKPNEEEIAFVEQQSWDIDIFGSNFDSGEKLDNASNFDYDLCHDR